MLAYQKEVPLLDIIAELGIVPGVTLDKVVWSPNFGLFEYVAGFDKGCWSHTTQNLTIITIIIIMAIITTSGLGRASWN